LNIAKSTLKLRVRKHLKAWDVEFIRVDQGTPFHIINVANYVNIQSLLDFTYKEEIFRVDKWAFE
jgi:hypothetical protein